MTDKIKSRPATAHDVREFFGQTPPQTIRARVLEVNGEIAGMAGYYMSNGVAVVFSDMKAEIPKVRIWREAVHMMKSIKQPAICNASEGSGPFLERLGWVRSGESEFGDVYEWHI